MPKGARVEEAAAQPSIVILNFGDLVNGENLSDQISTAFGSDGLGILLVRDIPGYVEARRILLPLAQKFSKLDETVKEKYVHKESCYSFGWSHGKEKLQGRPDVSKGSYYANPQYDRPVDDEDIIRKFPSFVHPNIWPTDDLPELETAFKLLGNMIVSVGILVAKQCDAYVHSIHPTYEFDKLQSIILQSKCCKARLLHYFPNDSIEYQENKIKKSSVIEEINAIIIDKEKRDHSINQTDNIKNSFHENSVKNAHINTDKINCSDNLDDEFSSWCGWHNDHGSLTGLTSAILLNEEGEIVEEADPESGLYIRNRKSELIKVKIPFDCLAFQIGETAQIHSGGVLQATPHAVKASKSSSMKGISRETFGVFMEPNWDYPMAVPQGTDPHSAQCATAVENLPPGVPSLLSRWTLDQFFGDFTKKCLEAYH